MNFKKRLTDQQAGFQMAPMIDIMFLLLIFFMAATIYAQWERKIGITVPTADSAVRGARQAGEIIINVDADGEIVVNNVTMTLQRLESLLAQVAETYRDQPVIIRADAKTDHENVIAVLDICAKVDIRNVAFAALSKEDEPSR